MESVLFMKNQMYLNVDELLELIECMEQENMNNVVLATLHEVKELILDLHWIELKENIIGVMKWKEKNGI